MTHYSPLTLRNNCDKNASINTVNDHLLVVMFIHYLFFLGKVSVKCFQHVKDCLALNVIAKAVFIVWVEMKEFADDSLFWFDIKIKMKNIIKKKLTRILNKHRRVSTLKTLLIQWRNIYYIVIFLYYNTFKPR